MRTTISGCWAATPVCSPRSDLRLNSSSGLPPHYNRNVAMPQINGKEIKPEWPPDPIARKKDAFGRQNVADRCK
jgi:hypothetical protein